MKYPFNIYYSGFFLIELLVAIGLLSIFSLLVAQYQVKIISVEYDSLKYRQALNLANDIIEEIAISKSFKNQFLKDDFTVNLESLDGLLKGENLKKGNEQSNLKRLSLNRISVSWFNFSKKRQQISLEFGVIV